MKHNSMLTIASLLSILFMTFHLADDIIRGMASGQISNLLGVLILVVWLYGTLVLAERRSGHVIILLGSLLGLGVPVIHMMGKGVGVGGDIAKSSGAFFFVWTLIALGALMIPQAFWRADLVVVIVLAVAALWYFAVLRGRLARGEAGVDKLRS